ncbi:hypothetical protein TELCIR_00107 [Teladorsagia circumcincta]|uniref:Peptidase A2 domain-containing protein n=1 Tax=Teladorsagia circumcincta TaxID=45464 RepID=A0A2G9V5U3_TELCI|nr:hypothetical protein TELCIR_00107 [Teladorsagia circumcincta]
MRHDTGADVALLSHADWIVIGRPTLHSPRITEWFAINEPINVQGRYECNSVIDGEHGRGTCYVADTPSLSGLGWITQHEPLLYRIVYSKYRRSHCRTRWNCSLPRRHTGHWQTID